MMVALRHQEAGQQLRVHTFSSKQEQREGTGNSSLWNLQGHSYGHVSSNKATNIQVLKTVGVSLIQTTAVLHTG